MAEKFKKNGGVTAGICTSGSRVKLAVLAGGGFSSASKKSLNQEKLLFPMLDRLLGRRSARLKDLSALCVITGPGRFTGLRVGLTLAGVLKTLAGIRVYSSTLFEVLAGQAAASKEFGAWAAVRKCPRVAALTHAFKDEYFCQLFDVSGQWPVVSDQRPGAAGSKSRATSHEPRSTDPKCTPVGPPRWLKDVEMAEYLKAAGRDLYVIADSEEKPEIYALVPSGCGKAPPRISKILPEFVIKTGLALRNRDLSPLYLKPAKYELGNHADTARA
ncbi:MAG: tRNA (adenosine(37)-N6)-threonylcarbamoyltransferase complex dimerization subunit type 1 TsaB [Elusimicrobia bacterium GWA2_56_46]|nr:MAG: tRNA (adenosine(37)-N6)-threonylcarbamoyltransferase complex dimerization subunit type 1 TsaB [Elusimicrobia bacterium GWA2_56_46]OGR54350.1 MAG: tRNA (adenosine(37)-N6)-threonylcarbamoyltransferase complex dimerization subunit type 1 TsaB [Elusimicrobia bacterium GWC2_56_31]